MSALINYQFPSGRMINSKIRVQILEEMEDRLAETGWLWIHLMLPICCHPTASPGQQGHTGHHYLRSCVISYGLRDEADCVV